MRTQKNNNNGDSTKMMEKRKVQHSTTFYNGVNFNSDTTVMI